MGNGLSDPQVCASPAAKLDDYIRCREFNVVRVPIDLALEKEASLLAFT
jgi:hypothetical protein